jgi:histidinol-phosphate phosphatase family protein
MVTRRVTDPVTTVVVPTVGRESLTRLLDALACQDRPLDVPVIVVDDRPSGDDLRVPDTALDVRVLRSGGGGPARARNLGWRHARTEWVSFLDDDVVPGPWWYADLLADLERAGDALASAGRVHVPLPDDRRPTDWERGTAGLATSKWITADLSYRRAALSLVGGFDERFPRAFREDADLALRVVALAHGDPDSIIEGRRAICHPIRPSDDWASLRQQAGNIDDGLMRARHGSDWHARAGAPEGRIRRHVAITVSAALGLAGLGTRHRLLAFVGLVGWVAGTAEFAWARIAPGPRDRREVRRMVMTSVAIPPAAVRHHVRGRLRHDGAPPWRGVPDLVLVDRDGTLVEDVPYNRDPGLVRPMPDAADALRRLRAAGLRVAVVTNQSGVASSRIAVDELVAVNARVEELLGPFDGWYVCPHGRDDGCTCRKPAPGMVKEACADHDVPPWRCVLIGDIGSDVEAAEAAGARGLLVPTPATRRDEIDRAPRVADSLSDAVDLVLGGRW